VPRWAILRRRDRTERLGKTFHLERPSLESARRSVNFAL
jgi:hypothetical protein